MPRPEILVTTGDDLVLNQKRVNIDCHRFVELSQSGERLALEEAVALYGGEFLNGFSLDNCPEFEKWLLYSRQQHERLYLTALDALVESKKATGEIFLISLGIGCMSLIC